MALSSSSTTNTTQFVQYQSSEADELLPGLPHDLALECLLRVPIASHPSIRLVSHFWKSTISDTSFFSFRRDSNTAENLVFLVQPVSPAPLPPPSPPPQTEHGNIVPESPYTEDGVKSHGNENGNGNTNPLLYNLNMYNISHKKWHCLAGISIPAFSQVVVFKEVGKLVALGGWDPTTLENISRVVVVDLASGTWREGSTMPTARSFFACAAVGPTTVYVAGGHDGQKNALRSAEVYDVLADQWRALPPMAEERDESYGFCLENDENKEARFCVVSGYGTDSQGRFRSDAEVFDPENGVWVMVAGLWPHSGITPKSTAVVTVEGRKRWWHVIGVEVREFEWEEKEWKVVNMGRVSESLNGLWATSTSVCLVDVGDGKIFVMGNNGENCGGKGVFILEQQNNYSNNARNNEGNLMSGGINWIWQHVDTPPSFFGFPFSASHIYI